MGELKLKKKKKKKKKHGPESNAVRFLCLYAVQHKSELLARASAAVAFNMSFSHRLHHDCNHV